MGKYDKKILYLDYLENGEKIKNAGFAKLLQQGGQYRLSMHISGLYETDTLKCDFSLLTDRGEPVLDTLYLQKGACSYSCLFTQEELQKRHIRMEDAYGICIKISGQRSLKALWREPRAALSAPEPMREPQPVQPEPMREPQPVMTEPIVELQSTLQELTLVQESETVSRQEPALVQESAAISQQEPVSTGEQETIFVPAQEVESSAIISDDKWEQLEHVFPVIHPFGDEKEYLSLTPKDFIILNRDYQTLANNSFLLHGFYNYHHIILGKMMHSGQEFFYLGVPGVFYEREKAVAIMFGFESFECAKEPAQTGTFGYYMKRVEI